MAVRKEPLYHWITVYQTWTTLSADVQLRPISHWQSRVCVDWHSLDYCSPPNMQWEEVVEWPETFSEDNIGPPGEGSDCALLGSCSTSVLGRRSLMQRWRVINLRPHFTLCQNNTTICLHRLRWRRKEADFRSSLRSIMAPKAFLAEALHFLHFVIVQWNTWKKRHVSSLLTFFLNNEADPSEAKYFPVPFFPTHN